MTPGAPVSVVRSPGTPAPLQRALDPDEAEAEAAAEAAGPALEPPAEGSPGEDDDQGDDGEDGVQAKLASGGGTSASAGLDLHALHRRINPMRGTGSAIEDPLRARLEEAFAADFSAVRLHTDERAAGLARTVHALAFTSGRDVFFGQGRYAPDSTDGQRLLAHELAHVVQQGAASTRRSPAPMASTVQCAPDPQALTTHGVLYFFDAGSDDPFYDLAVSNSGMVAIGPGFYEVRVTARASDYVLQVGGESYTLTVTNKKEFDDNLKRARALRLYMLAFDKPDSDPDAAKKKPTAKDPTGSPPPADKPKTKPGDKPAGTVGEPKKAGEEKQGEPGKEPKGKPGTEPKDVPGAGKTGGVVGTTGSGGGLGGSGSKYGWLGLFNLPKPLVRIMEGIIDLLGDGEELKGLRDTLQAIREIYNNRDELKDLFKDSSTLLEIALGLKENKAVEALAKWVAADTGAPKPAKNADFAGIVGLATKVTALLRKVRGLLKPVFKVRGQVQSVVGGIALLLEEVPALEHLMDLAEDPAKAATALGVATDEFVAELTERLEQKFGALPQVLKLTVEKLAEADLVTFEELARGVTAAIVMGLPRHYRWIAKAARAIGLEKKIADNLVAPMIPSSVLSFVNDTIRSLFKLAQPVFDAALTDLTKVVKELGSGLASELPAVVKDAFKPAAKPEGVRLHFAPMEIARVAQASAGQPLDDDVLTHAQTRLGHSFADVRVHSGVAANELAERLHANALTIGRDIYFGPGRFAPHSEAGRRLLDHELTHVAQQAQPTHGLDVQYSYKDLLARLAKRLSAAALKELKGATPVQSKRAMADAIKDRAAKLVGRVVESRTNPALPTGYMYIPKTGAKIANIRRTLAWIRYIPALTIDKKTRRIKLTATLSSYDPKAAARAMLRRALGCGPQQEAHHLVPLEELFHPVAQTAIKNGWKFNGADNGLCISDKIHSGSHATYTADVRRRLDRLKLAFGNDWTKLETPFLAELATLKSELSRRRKRLD